MCDALVALGSAVIEQKDFMFRHGNANTAFFKPVTLTVGDLGDPRSKGSGFREILTWAATTGRYDLSALPADWHEPIAQHAPSPTKPPRKRGFIRTGIKVRVSDLQASIVPDSTN